MQRMRNDIIKWLLLGIPLTGCTGSGRGIEFGDPGLPALVDVETARAEGDDRGEATRTVNRFMRGREDGSADPHEDPGSSEALLPDSERMPFRAESRDFSERSSSTFANGGVSDAIQLVVRQSPRGPERLPGSVLCLIEVFNRSNRRIEDVWLECDLSRELSLPGRDERRIQSFLGPLLPGARQTIRLVIRGQHAGRFTLPVRIRSGARVIAEQPFRVEIPEGQLWVEVLHPGSRMIGDTAEFLVVVRNHRDVAANDVRVEMEFEDWFQPIRASRGAVQTATRLAWELGTVPPGNAVLVSVEFRCERISERCLVSTRCEAEGQVAAENFSEFPIMAIPGSLHLKLSDGKDPVSVGETTEIQLSLQNCGDAPVRRAGLQVRVPSRCRIGRVVVMHDRQRVHWKTVRSQEGLTFEPLTMLPPGEQVDLRIEITSSSPGPLRILARAGVDPIDQLPELTEWLMVVPASPASVDPGR